MGTHVEATASLARALANGRADHAAHALLLLLTMDTTMDESGAASKTKPSPVTLLQQQARRLATLQRAVAKTRDLLNMQRRVSLEIGLAPSSGDVASPLSFAQLQMFTLQSLTPQSTAYNITTAMRMHDLPFDPRALEATSKMLLAKHDVLRTVFSINNYGEPQQRVVPMQQVGSKKLLWITEIDRESLEHDDKTARVVLEKTTAPFDLLRDVPIRFYAFTDRAISEWVLAVVMHHVATDPASSRMFWRDFDSFYTNFLSKTLPSDEINVNHLLENSPPCLSYRDYAVWQRQALDSGLFASSLEYWVRHLASDDGVHPPMELPYDNPPLASQEHLQTQRRGQAIVFHSSPSQQQAFTRLCASQGASVFMGLLAVFHILVSRVSRSDDFVIGVPASSRTDDRLTGLMGYFVNTLPLRIVSQDDGDFATFLQYVKRVVLEGLRHREIPFQKIVENIAVERTSPHTNGVFQVIFAWENEEDCKATPPPQRDPIVLPHTTAKFDLMLTMKYTHATSRTSGDEKTLQGTLEYPSDLFDASTIQRFTRYFLELIDQVTRLPADRKLSSIQMIPRDERGLVVDQWGAPPVVTDDKVLFLDEYLHRQVLATPENVALRFEGTTWTYKEMWLHSQQLARCLLSSDTGNPMKSLVGQRVGLFLDRGLENVASILAVLQVRAVFIPLDTSFPVERIRYMIQDSQAEIVLTQRHLAPKLYELLEISQERDANSFSRLRVILCEDALSSGTEETSISSSAIDRITSLAPDDTTAYILYTSGSTGNPKGVMVSHANLLTTLQWTVREYAVGPSDVFLQSTSSTLDGSLTQLLSPLLVGGSALVTKTNGLHDLTYLAGLLTTYRVTFCVFVPSYFVLLIDFMGQFPAYIKHVILAGESFPTALADKFYHKHALTIMGEEEPGTCLVNEYGPTEASVTSTFFRYPREMALVDTTSNSCDIDLVAKITKQQQSVPIGRGIDDHYVIVLDTYKRLVPVNVPGELYVGGRGVAQGYWNRPDLTAKSFHHEELKWLDNYEEDKETDRPLRRWYKTGDLVKWLPNGELVFLGRTDSQVKLRGMRIELQEIRNVLLQSRLVKDAEVLVVGQRLVAYVIWAATASAEKYSVPTASNVSQLQQSISTRLPVHMVPHEIITVREWPRTPNGKLDLRALAKFKPAAVVHYHQPRKNPANDHGDSPKSKATTSAVAVDIITQAWRQVLDLHHDDADDMTLQSASFFELGGDSLAAIRVISLVKPHGLIVTLDAFFQCKTLVEMAAKCGSTLAMTTSQSTKQPAQVTATATTNLDASSTIISLNWKKPSLDDHLNDVGDDNNAETPLFLIHCADGTVWKLMELARRLPFPVLGLRATHGGQATSVEELARAYWNEIQAVQRGRKYRLGGYSFGCRIAHAIAVLGQAEGASFHPLTMLDGIPFHFSTPKNDNEPHEDGDEEEDEKAAEYVARTLGMPQPPPSQAFTSDDQMTTHQDAKLELFRQLTANYVCHCRLDRRYRPALPDRHEAGKIATIHARLFKTSDWQVDETAYLSYGVDIEIIPVDGEHLTMLKTPHVERVAQALMENL